MEYVLIILLSWAMIHNSEIPKNEYRETTATIIVERHPVTGEMILEVKQ